MLLELRENKKMTQGNNLVITVFGVKDDGKTTLGNFFLETLSTPSIVIDVTEQFVANRRYKKVISCLNEMKYILSNPLEKRLFYKGKIQLIFRPNGRDKKKVIEDLMWFILEKKIHGISIFFDEIETYANNKINDKSGIFNIFHMSRNKQINIIAICKVFGMLSQLIKAQSDYFAISQVNDIPSFEYLQKRSFKKFGKEIENIGKHEFLITNLNHQKNMFWEKYKLSKSHILELEKKTKKQKKIK